LQASPTKSLTVNNYLHFSTSFLSILNVQLYDNSNDSRQWSEVSTITTSVIKSGPRESYKHFMAFSFFGFPPDMLTRVKFSSGPNNTKSGPNTTLDSLVLKSNN